MPMLLKTKSRQKLAGFFRLTIKNGIEYFSSLRFSLLLSIDPLTPYQFCPE